ncbi:MAG TPA: hypothetical protein DCX49_03100, partial [Flavobacteriales bacterium]|nr:hypothetical protein [Flavobacteriales bacterium]
KAPEGAFSLGFKTCSYRTTKGLTSRAVPSWISKKYMPAGNHSTFMVWACMAGVTTKRPCASRNTTVDVLDNPSMRTQVVAGFGKTLNEAVASPTESGVGGNN